MTNPAPRHRLYWLLVLMFVLAWASGFSAAKIAITTAPPALFGGIRFLLAGLMLLGWATWRGELRRDTPWRTLALLGLLNQAGYQGLAWQGLGNVSAGLATIIASLNPILIAVLAAPLLGERLTGRKIAGLVLGFAGAVFVVRHRIATAGEGPAGVLLVVGALLSLVAGTLAFKRFAPDTSLSVAVGVQTTSAGLALLTLGTLFEDTHLIAWDARFWLVMAWCILVVSIASLMLWFWLLRNGSATSASALHFLIPPIGLAMSWLALGERISPEDLLGILPVALGIWLVTRGGSPPPLDEATTPR